jgi:hypothetical protein
MRALWLGLCGLNSICRLAAAKKKRRSGGSGAEDGAAGDVGQRLRRAAMRKEKANAGRWLTGILRR